MLKGFISHRDEEEKKVVGSGAREAMQLLSRAVSVTISTRDGKRQHSG